MEQQEIGLEQLIQALPPQERLPVAALMALHQERSQLDQDQEMKLQQVKKKFMDRVAPLLTRAAQLISGGQPKPQEVDSLRQYLKPGEKAPQLKGKIIESYWNGAFENSALMNFISQKDQQALENLLNIQIAESEPDTVSLKFTFKTNPYFVQTTAVRRLRFSQGQAVCLQGDLLTPKAGNWLTHESKKVTNKGNGQTKSVQGKKIDSFFDIFLNLTAVDNPKQLSKCSQIMQELVSVVRDSLNYFLGMYELNESQQDLQEYEDEQQEQEQNNKGKKQK